MAENKTKPTTQSVLDFLNAVEHPTRKADGLYLYEAMKKVTGLEPRMWGPTIVGYGEYHYKYDSGHEGDSLRIGFSPRKSSLSLYIMPNLDAFPDLMEKLGKYKMGRGCLYINKLADVDLEVLEELMIAAYGRMEELYPSK